jgi:hypothetical protein
MNYDAHIKDYTNEGGGGNHRWATRANFGNSIMSWPMNFNIGNILKLFELHSHSKIWKIS